MQQCSGTDYKKSRSNEINTHPSTIKFNKQTPVLTGLELETKLRGRKDRMGLYMLRQDDWRT